jgi:hypothetical protein
MIATIATQPYQGIELKTFVNCSMIVPWGPKGPNKTHFIIFRCQSATQSATQSAFPSVVARAYIPWRGRFGDLRSTDRSLSLYRRA